MSDFSIPHIKPLRFVQSLLESTMQSAIVKIGFDDIPTFGMLIEAAVQSSSGILDDKNDIKMGFLISLKNVKLLEKIDSKEYIVKIKLMHKIDDFKSISYKIFKGDNIIMSGAYSIVLR